MNFGQLNNHYIWQILQKKEDLLEIIFFLIIPLHPDLSLIHISEPTRDKRQTEVNKTRKSRYKIALKKMKKLIDSKKKKEALSYLPKLNSELMKIAKTGVIKKGNATRNVSKITRKINSL